MNVNFKVKQKKSRLAWFTTHSGKKFSFGCVVTVGISSFAITLLPHTFFLDTYREFFQLYRKSVPVRVSAKLKEQVSTVLDDLKVPDDARALLKPFMVNGFNLFHAGTTYLNFGALVGIPINLSYVEETDIDKANLLVQNKNIDWSTTDGKNLISALLLSEDAKKFAIAHEVLRCQTPEVLLYSTYPVIITGMAYTISQKINRMTNGFSGSLPRRIFMYSLVGLFCLGNWAFFKDFTNIYYDANVDSTLAELGKDYIKGGQEYYSKILDRNKVLRNLMGKEGAKLYSASGNEEFFIRQKRMPLVHKKFYFDKLMEDLN